MDYDYLKNQSYIDIWNKKSNNFNCPHFIEKNDNKFQTSPCSYCANPECPKNMKIMF